MNEYAEWIIGNDGNAVVPCATWRDAECAINETCRDLHDAGFSFKPNMGQRIIKMGNRSIEFIKPIPEMFRGRRWHKVFLPVGTFYLVNHSEIFLDELQTRLIKKSSTDLIEESPSATAKMNKVPEVLDDSVS